MTRRIPIFSERSKVETISGVDSYLRLEIIDETPERSHARRIALIAVIVGGDDETFGLLHDGRVAQIAAIYRLTWITYCHAKATADVTTVATVAVTAYILIRASSSVVTRPFVFSTWVLISSAPL